MWGKGWRFLWLLPLPLSLLAGDRDPFLPPEDRCQTAQLAQWRYGGAVGHRHYWVGYLLDHRNQWRRVRRGRFAGRLANPFADGGASCNNNRAWMRTCALGMAAGKRNKI